MTAIKCCFRSCDWLISAFSRLIKDVWMLTRHIKEEWTLTVLAHGKIDRS